LSEHLIFIIVSEDALANLFCSILQKNKIETKVFDNVSSAKVFSVQQPSAILVDLKLINSHNKEILGYLQNQGTPIILISQYDNYDIVNNYKYFDICSLPLDHDRFNLVITNALNMYNIVRENVNIRNRLNNVLNSEFITRDDRILTFIKKINEEADIESIIIIGEKNTGKSTLGKYLANKNIFKNFKNYKINAENIVDLNKKLEHLLRCELESDTKFFLEINSPFPQWEGWEEVIRQTDGFEKSIIFTLPPLRHRLQDIELLINNTLEKMNSFGIGSSVKISKDAVKQLTEYSWPGNIVELNNTMKNALVLSGNGCIEKNDINLALKKETQHQNATNNIVINNIITMDEFKKKIIDFTYEKCNGNVEEAAKKLKIGRATFYRLLQKYK